MQYMIDVPNTPWIPLGPGESFKPLRFMSGGRVLLLRVEPGTVVPRHRHQGEVHVFNVAGSRLLDTGEIAGPGAYVHEAAGNVDSWTAIGDEPCILHIVAFGAMEYLDENDQVIRTDTASSLRELADNHRHISPPSAT